MFFLSLFFIVIVIAEVFYLGSIGSVVLILIYAVTSNMIMSRPVEMEKGHQRFKAKNWICHILLRAISHWPKLSHVTTGSCKGGWLMCSVALWPHTRLNNFWYYIIKRKRKDNNCGVRGSLGEFVVSLAGSITSSKIITVCVLFSLQY